MFGMYFERWICYELFVDKQRVSWTLSLSIGLGLTKTFHAVGLSRASPVYGIYRQPGMVHQDIPSAQLSVI